jgi:hypothetical protein
MYGSQAILTERPGQGKDVSVDISDGFFPNFLYEFRGAK